MALTTTMSSFGAVVAGVTTALAVRARALGLRGAIRSATATTTTSQSGEFVRRPTDFHDVISEDHTKYQPEAGRYHLFVSKACPWASRCLAVRALKGLKHVISVTVVEPKFDTSPLDPAGYKGWPFKATDPCPVDPSFTHIDQLYELASPGFRASYNGTKPYYAVPVLFDLKTSTIVSNESSEIIAMFNNAFNKWATKPDHDLLPSHLQAAMDEVDTWIYSDINNGVYRTGFARTQEAYEDAYNKLFDALDKVEAILSRSRYLTGDTLTMSDIRLFVTLIRFDTVYHTHFKCNKYRVADKPAMHGFMKELYQVPEIRETVDLNEIRDHYYASHDWINPFRIICPVPDAMSELTTPHGRDKLFPSSG